MRVLVTGGNGFLGSHLCEALVRAGHEVRSLVQPGTSLDNLKGIDAAVCEGDLCDAASLGRACAGREVLYHLAARVSDYGPWEAFRRVNVGGTQRLLEAAEGAGVRRLVLMSSLAVHGFARWRHATEDAPLGARDNPYARSKIEAEGLVRRAHLGGRIEAVIVRPGFFPFGPRDQTSFAPLARAIEQGVYRRLGSGKNVTCTAYAGNLAEGLVLCGEQAEAAGESFVLADEGAPTWGELSEKIAAALGCRLPRLGVPAPLARLAGDAMEALWRLARIEKAPPLTSYRVRVPLSDTHFSNAKARRLLGFAPRVGLEEGLKLTVEWYRRAKREGRL